MRGESRGCAKRARSRLRAMALNHAVSRIVTPKGDLNRMVWDGRPGHYEVYYLTLNVPEAKLGLWIRYTMVAPLNGEATLVGN